MVCTRVVPHLHDAVGGTKHIQIEWSSVRVSAAAERAGLFWRRWAGRVMNSRTRSIPRQHQVARGCRWPETDSTIRGRGNTTEPFCSSYHSTKQCQVVIANHITQTRQTKHLSTHSLVHTAHSHGEWVGGRCGASERVAQQEDARISKYYLYEHCVPGQWNTNTVQVTWAFTPLPTREKTEPLQNAGSSLC